MLTPLLLQGISREAILLLFFFFFGLLSLVLTVLSIYAVYWTYKDAQKRGIDSPELWALIVFFGNIFGLILYLIAVVNRQT